MNRLYYTAENFRTVLDQIVTGEITPTADELSQFYMFTFNHHKEDIAEHGLELYSWIKTSFTTYLDQQFAEAVLLQGVNLLQFYARLWTDYRDRAQWIDKGCEAFNEFWIKVQIENGNKDVYYIYKLSLVVWRDHELSHLHQTVATTILTFIERARFGESYGTLGFEEAVHSFLELGLAVDNSIIEVENLNFYNTTFETVFLMHLKSFYRKDFTRKLFEENTVIDYMQIVEKLITKETKPIYLHEDTIAKVVSIMDEALLKPYLDIFLTEFKKILVAENMWALLQIMHDLAGSRIPEFLFNMTVIFQEHIRDQGNLAIDRCVQVALVDPKTYVTTLFDVYRKYKEHVKCVPSFQYAFREGCKMFISKNVITMAAYSSAKSPQLVAKYCDTLLTKNVENRKPAGLDEKLNNINIVISLLIDRKSFLEFYSEMLAVRLLKNTYISHAVEMSMINKLKVSCDGTEDLKTMVSDIVESEDLTKRFISMLTPNEVLGISFTAQVLSSKCWPFQQKLTIILPDVLQNCLNNFTKFYSALYTNRELRVSYLFSEGMLRTNCFSKEYILQVNTLQMAILMQYNDNTSYTVKQLCENINLDEKDAFKILRQFIKQKLLVLKSAGTETNLDMNSTVELFTDFEYEHTVLKLTAPIRIGSMKLKEMPNELDRQKIRAAIANAMKHEKNLQHKVLIERVRERLSKYFEPSVRLIESCISELLNQKYLKETDEKDVYEFHL